MLFRSKSTLPEGATVIPCVWNMRHKRRLKSQEVYKWKAHLALDGSKQCKGKDYWETYAPVASWPAIRWILLAAIINGWFSCQLNYVMAYTQALPVKDGTFIAIPKGFEVDGVDDPENYVLEVMKNLYGGCDAGRAWYQHLVDRLLAEIGRAHV